ncbi:nucleotidyl transferase AbiEii/AbiGii toxin family protein [Patescibacteria group bacterium]
MITNETIIKLSAKFQTSEANVRREYFQHLFLSLFYRQEGIDEVYFKGGTALRLIYKSPRFSEDLDFDSPTANISHIENAIITTLSEAQKEGVETELDEAKTTTGGYLSIMRFSALGHIVPIKIEISFRDRKKKGVGVFISSDLFPDYSIIQLSEAQLVQGKINALLERKKPRDFFDFYFLLRRSMLPVTKGNIMKETLVALQKTDINFDSELKEFLPKNHHMIIKDFKTTLEREIKRYI